MYEELVKGLRDAFKTATEAQVNPYRFVPFYQKAADAIEELSKPRWIPVTERLPEEDGMYLVHGTWSASGRKVTDTCEFFVHDGYFRAAWNFDVTHWMPLPEPPKEEA